MKRTNFAFDLPQSTKGSPYYCVELDKEPREPYYSEDAFNNAVFKLGLEGHTIVSMHFPMVTTKDKNDVRTDWCFAGVSTNLTIPTCAFVVCATGYRK
ncbi:hypothetical protein JCM19231_2995 [Vibrio ishigakensis]|uniref:Uncharacterized protein n=1 Tax=Vibrio ishigakensis TaxID=1481914 RepID=A0A0B8NX00_9VIBR|nr:hypothetical protein [Vibrio ishigakensis]GAM55643.1 hypothetical protein JCM19231_2995 [Vibrio ishigakensis]